jgi:transcription elongation GreA/GreB family factor
MSLKAQLYNECLVQIRMRIETIQNAITSARESAANETKSSAGDKYETAREMLQQDIDRNLSQLAAAQELESVLQRIDPQRETDIVVPGSLVCTSKASYYLAIPAGKISVAGKTYMAVSAASPVGKLMAGKKAGDSFLLNGEAVQIVSVC